MFDPSKILEAVVSSQFGGKKKKKSSGFGSLLTGKTALLGLGAVGAAGAAWMAHKHFSKDAGGGAPPQIPTPTAPPTGGGSAFPPPPPPVYRSGAGAPAALSNFPPLPSLPSSHAPAFVPPSVDRRALFLVRVMVSAANADHEVDADERRRILGKAELLDLTPEERQLLEGELDRPLALHEVVSQARATGHAPRQVYAAGFLAIDPDTAAERAWLRRLAEGLGLAEAEVAALEASLTE